MMKGIIAGVGVLVVAGIVTVFSSAAIIGAGEVGVVRRFGQIQEEVLTEGLNWTAPFIDQVSTVDIRVQKSELSTSAASRDLQDVAISFAVNYQINVNDVLYLQRTVGSNYESIVLQPAIQEAVKNVTARYSSEEIVTRRAEISASIVDSLQAAVEEFGIIIRELNIIDLGFSAEFNAAIEARNIAEMDVLRAQQELARTEVEARQHIVAAEAEAEVMRLQNQEITPEILQKMWLETWNGQLPQVASGDTTMMIPFGSGFVGEVYE